jgi:hypothetical protein
VRRPGIGGRVRVDGLWAGVLTRRADIAPSGQSAWTEIHVAAVSRPGSECHAGTWREALGPTIGDSLAVARTRLRFTRKREIRADVRERGQNRIPAPPIAVARPLPTIQASVSRSMAR